MKKTNRYEHMHICDYASVENFIKMLVSNACTLCEQGTVELYAKSPFMQDVFRALIREYGFKCGYLDFATEEYGYDEYGMEYCMVLNNDNCVCIEPAYREKDGEWIPLRDSADRVFLYQEDCEQVLIDTVLDNNDPENVVLFGIGEQLYEEPKLDKGDKNASILSEDDKLSGFTFSKQTKKGSYSCSLYSNDKEFVDRMKKKVEKLI